MDLPEIELVNWGLLKNPINWIIVFLMVLIALFAAHIVLGQHNGGGPQPTASS